MKSPSVPVPLPPQALPILARGTEFRTPCGEGHIVWHGWGSGEPLMLLHGGSGSWMHWIRNVEALAASGRRVLVPDLPGCGDSARPPGGQDADVIVPPLAAGLRQLTGDQPCDVVGFSFGGMVATLLAAAHPDQVRRLVLMAAPGLGLRSRRLPVADWRRAPDHEARLAAHRRNLQVWMLHRPEAIDALALAVQAANVPRDRLLRRRLSLTELLKETLPRLGCRVDAIYGEQDSLYREHYDKLRPALAQAPRFGELVFVPDAGHWLQYEQPERVNRALVRLLAS